MLKHRMDEKFTKLYKLCGFNFTIQQRWSSSMITNNKKNGTENMYKNTTKI